jgi:hypothetical protein
MVRGQRQTVRETPISKTTSAKWTGDVAQAVKHLVCKHEAKFKPPSHQKIGEKKMWKENLDKPQYMNDSRKI